MTTDFTVPLNPLYELLATLVSRFPLVYRLAVVVSKFAPATNGADALFSVNPCASLGLYPCAGSVSEIVLLLNPDGADGTAFTWKNIPALSVCAVMSGVPLAVKSNS